MKETIHKFGRAVLRYWNARRQRAFEKKRQKEQAEQERKTLLFYSQFISRNSLCFDIGANVGNRTKHFLMLGARVVAVEPQEDCAEYLNTTFGANEHFRLVKQAVGPQEGQAEIYMTSENTISSMSGDWIDAVRKSGRFAQYSWDRKQIVPMTTLDKLIGEYGVPDFIKIDVEGFEYEVLKGLNRSVKAISIEFTPEFLASTLNCIEHLKTIGPIRLNYSVGEGMKLALKRWTTPEELTRILKTTPDDARFFGDVYIRFLDTNDNCSITGVLKNE